MMNHYRYRALHTVTGEHESGTLAAADVAHARRILLAEHKWPTAIVTPGPDSVIHCFAGPKGKLNVSRPKAADHATTRRGPHLGSVGAALLTGAIFPGPALAVVLGSGVAVGLALLWAWAFGRPDLPGRVAGRLGAFLAKLGL